FSAQFSAALFALGDVFEIDALEFITNFPKLSFGGGELVIRFGKPCLSSGETIWCLSSLGFERGKPPADLGNPFSHDLISRLLEQACHFMTFRASRHQRRSAYTYFSVQNIFNKLFVVRRWNSSSMFFLI